MFGEQLSEIIQPYEFHITEIQKLLSHFIIEHTIYPSEERHIIHGEYIKQERYCNQQVFQPSYLFPPQPFHQSFPFCFNRHFSSPPFFSIRILKIGRMLNKHSSDL